MVADRSYDLNHSSRNALALPEFTDRTLNIPPSSQHPLRVPVATLQEHDVFGSPQAQRVHDDVIETTRQQFDDCPSFCAPFRPLSCLGDLNSHILRAALFVDSRFHQSNNELRVVQGAIWRFALLEHAQT